MAYTGLTVDMILIAGGAEIFHESQTDGKSVEQVDNYTEDIL